MPIKEQLLKLLRNKKAIKTPEIVEYYNGQFTRQYIVQILRQLLAEGLIVKVGSTRNALYTFPEYGQKYEAELGYGIKKRLKNQALKEHEVADTINHQLLFISSLGENVQSIFDYAFSEMMNNAIEHSKSDFIEVEVSKKGHDLCFVINDFGIGVFRNVMKEHHLKSELEAIEELLKGKTTTQPQAHSGEGIFFTSKVADVFILESFGYRLRIDNLIKDVFVEELKPSKRGTKVTFSLRCDSEKHLSDVFKRFQTGNAAQGFDKTEIQVKLYTMGTIHISRSQARRIMHGLERFKSIILDFDKVPTVGQAFADEIFRVFQQRYPTLRIKAVNMNEAVKFMVDRVEKPE